ncbi:MAG TPA: sigma-54 dependent transcriptional regulator [Myxococcota bacterium]|jgi:transcriptional regulator with GAF, ATPase, and Fis domain|nr:sigma-54 dependent transcriptional regulator [Myxococcota bacterium]
MGLPAEVTRTQVHEPHTIFTASLSPLVQELVWKARRVAPTDTSILILGETGTGKEHLALGIHDWSRRADQPFVKINCAAIPATLLESELFGHVKGAFTGATRDRLGRFQTATGGTLMLDEIAELTPDLQAKLLRVLQEGTFFRVGSDESVVVDVRVLAATHVDLERAIAEGRFRADLYYRLGVFPLELTPLRERLEDLPFLCELMVGELASRTGRTGLHLTPAAVEKLLAHEWPGNLRELANALERAVILSPADELGPELFDLGRVPGRPPRMNGGAPGPPRGPPPLLPPVESAAGVASPLPGMVSSLDEVQRRHIAYVMGLTGGRVYGERGAARLLGLKPSTLQSRMKRLGLQCGRATAAA